MPGVVEKPPVAAPPAANPDESTGLYTPLEHGTKSIRLFRISPDFSDRLVLELKAFQLESADCPPFASLSYMWGGSYPGRRDVIINDRVLRVRPNAFLFLETLRNHQRRRIEEGSQGLPRQYPRGNPLPGPPGGYLEWIWMDSICINQSDPNERNHQVGLMQKIYSLAEHVLFHIGPGAARAQREIDGLFPEKNKLVLQNWARKGWPRYIMENVAGIINSSEYAMRLWVVQELVLARRVSFVTADWMVPFPDLADAGALASIVIARHDWHGKKAKENPGSSLIALLKHYHTHRCEKKIDRVFGLLGICSDKIPIDYNLTPRLVVIETLAYLIFKEPEVGSHVLLEQHRSIRLADAVMNLQKALDYVLKNEDYGIIARRLGEMACSSGLEVSQSWWLQSPPYSSTDAGVILRDKLKYDPQNAFWDNEYDSTDEANIPKSTERKRSNIQSYSSESSEDIPEDDSKPPKRSRRQRRQQRSPEFHFDWD